MRLSRGEGEPMLTKSVLSPILYNEALTRGLGDPESQLLTEWLVEQAEHFADTGNSAEAVQRLVTRLLHRARSIGRFVSLWCYQGARGAAGQLAAAERFHWPMPPAQIDPHDLMNSILIWENGQLRMNSKP